MATVHPPSNTVLHQDLALQSPLGPIAIPLPPQQVQLQGQEDPRNWTLLKKWTTALIISLMGFVGPLGASIVIASARGMSKEFQLGPSHTLTILPVSFFVLGLGAGPFFLAPASELKGRQPVYILSSVVFVIFNLASSFSPNLPTLCVLRFLAGAFGSSGPSLGAGTIGDMFLPDKRGSAQAIYGLGPLLGPVVGNIIGGWVDQSGERNWRWLLWILTIMSAIVAAVVTLFVQETYAPVLLQRKRKRLAAETLDLSKQLDTSRVSTLSAVGPTPQIVALGRKATLRHRAMTLIPGPAAKEKMKLAFSRPCRLLFTNPICAAFSFYMGFCYGIIFLFLVEHPLLFQKRESFSSAMASESTPPSPVDRRSPPPLYNYQWEPGPTGLTYLGLGLGFLIAALCNAVFADRVYRRLVASRGRVGWYLFRRPASIEAIMQRRDEAAAVNRHEDVEQMSRTDSGQIITVVAPALPPTAHNSGISGSSSSTSHTDYKAAASFSSPPRKGQPEYRLPLCLVGMLILPIGLFVFGWTAQQGVHWILPLVGSVLVGAGTIICFQSILVYLVDAFIPYSASATACAVLVRSVLAAVFPLFSEQMFRALGFGWGSSLLALLALAGLPIPLILFRYGAFLREKYKFVA